MTIACGLDILFGVFYDFNFLCTQKSKENHFHAHHVGVQMQPSFSSYKQFSTSWQNNCRWEIYSVSKNHMEKGIWLRYKLKILCSLKGEYDSSSIVLLNCCKLVDMRSKYAINFQKMHIIGKGWFLKNSLNITFL